MSRPPGPIYLYNPAFLAQDERLDQFVARQTELGLVLQALNDSEGGASRHTLVMGPRGIGKSTFLLRVLAEIRDREELTERWQPVPLAEESYAVGSVGQLWLEVLLHLGRVTGEDRWIRVHSELAREESETVLRERALGQLLDFADRRNCRLVVLVENLQQLLGEQLSPDDAWVLRHTMLNEPRILFLGSATANFAAIDDPDQALYGLFHVLSLEPLDEDACARLWTRLTGRLPDPAQLRAIGVFTGGNPRLVTILASIADSPSIVNLGQQLEALVDQHTEYFKGHLDSLPAGERTVYVTLLELWKPATAREVAQAGRQDVNKTSAYLRRLLVRGWVRIDRTEGRNHWYIITERLFSIYYQLRRSGRSAARVEAMARFLAEFDPEDRFIARARQAADHALAGSSADFGSRALEYRALVDAAPHLAERVRALMQPEFLERLADWEASRDASGYRVAEALKAATLAVARSTPALAEELLRRAVATFPHSARAWCDLGQHLLGGKEIQEAERCFRRALDLDPDHLPAWSGLERVGSDVGNHAARARALVMLNRPAEALEALGRHLSGARSDLSDLADTSEGVVQLARLGFSGEVLHLLEVHSWLPSVEPLRVGLRIHLGVDTVCAPEIQEVARGVASRIGHMSQEGRQS